MTLVYTLIAFKVWPVLPQNLYYYHIYFGVHTLFSGNKYSWFLNELVSFYYIDLFQMDSPAW